MPGTIGVIGAGLVGAATAYMLTLLPDGGDVILIDIDQARAEAEALDISHAATLNRAWKIRAGSYQDLAGADLVVITAGVSLKPGQTRLELVKSNTAIVSSILEQTLKYAPDVTLLFASNPVDVMPALAVKRFGVKRHKAVASGNSLDSARFQERLGRHLGVAAPSVIAHSIGEHGDSQVLHWSAARVGNLSLAQFAEAVGKPIDRETRDLITQEVKTSAYGIKKGKGVSNFGIGGCLARLSRAITGDEQAVFSVSTYMDEILGVEETAISLPHVLGRDGAFQPLLPELDDEEREGLKRSAEILRGVIADALAG